MSDPNDFSAFKPLVMAIEEARIRHDKPRAALGGYLMGVAIAYMQYGGATEEEIRHTFEVSLHEPL